MDIWQQILDFEPFLRLLGIQAELLGPDDVVLRLPMGCITRILAER